MGDHVHTHAHTHPAEHTHEHVHRTQPTLAHERSGYGAHHHDHAEHATGDERLRGALDETTRMLAYLWDAWGQVDGFAVKDGFAAADPIREDVSRVIDEARAALGDQP